MQLELKDVTFNKFAMLSSSWLIASSVQVQLGTDTGLIITVRPTHPTRASVFTIYSSKWMASGCIGAVGVDLGWPGTAAYLEMAIKTGL